MKISSLLLILLFISCAEEKRPAFMKPEYLEKAAQMLKGSSSYATVSLRSADYTSGAFAFINTKTFEVSQNYGSRESDINVQCQGSNIYHIGKYNVDTITKYSLNARVNPVWQKSTMDSNDGVNGEQITTSNPYNLAFDGVGRAFLTRFDSSRMWEVALDSNRLKKTEIEFLGLADSDTKPEQADALVHNDYLITLLARIDRTGANWEYSNTPYLSILNKDNYQDVKTIHLTNKNPNKLKVHGNQLFIAAQGDIWDSNSTLKGGIEIVNLDSLSKEENILTEYKITDFVVDNDYIYFLNYLSFGNVELRKFDRATKQVTLAESGNITSISSLAGSLWVSYADNTQPYISILVTPNLVETDRIDTNLVVQKIEFCTL